MFMPLDCGQRKQYPHANKIFIRKEDSVTIIRKKLEQKKSPVCYKLSHIAENRVGPKVTNKKPNQHFFVQFRTVLTLTLALFFKWQNALISFRADAKEPQAKRLSTA